MLKPIIILGTAAFVMRTLSALMRLANRRELVSAGWLASGLAAWLVVATAGGWVPWWPSLFALLWIFTGKSRSGFLPATWADFILVIVVGGGSCPEFSPIVLILLALANGLLGFSIDKAVSRLRSRKKHVVPAFIAIGGLAVLYTGFPLEAAAYISRNPAALKNLGMTTPLNGKQIRLASGHVAWLDRPKSTPRAGVLFFHGFHKNGGKQAAAQAVRRALLANGFLVLSLDHPGFGNSPRPARDAPLEEWNPLPADLSAYDELRARLGSDRIFFVGHSMGTGEVARMLATDRPARGAAMLGAGFTKSKPSDGEFWYGRFQKIMRFDPPLSKEAFAKIASTYNDKSVALRKLPPVHAPVLFVKFLRENPDLTRSRDEFYAMIPGTKFEAECASGHYLDVEILDSVLVGDVMATRRLARVLSYLEPTSPPVAGSPVKKTQATK